MPKLLVFVPCEKVIISQEENNPTLIAIVSEFQGEYVTKKKPLEPEAVVPARWSVFTMWQQQPGDEDKQFEQIIKLRSPTGKLAIKAVSEFRLPKRTHRLTFHFPSLPIAEPGMWTLELYAGEKGAVPQPPLATYEIAINFKERET